MQARSWGLPGRRPELLRGHRHHRCPPQTWCSGTARPTNVRRGTSYAGMTCSSTGCTATTTSSTTRRRIRSPWRSAGRCCGTASSMPPAGTPPRAPWASCWAIRRADLRNCVFRNQPDSGSHDEGGVDFENSGNGCLIDQCTFENNAGRRSRCWVQKRPRRPISSPRLRASSGTTRPRNWDRPRFTSGDKRDPSVCCSTGLIQGNGYVTRPGIEFYVNEAPALTSWTLRDNRGYATVEELELAKPSTGRRSSRQGRHSHRPAFVWPVESATMAVRRKSRR